MAARKRFRLNSDRLSKKPGLYPDGDGLYLSVTSKTAASWMFRYADGWKVSAGGARYPNTREMGLGSYPEIDLKRARELAGEARQLKAKGIDPINERNRLEGQRRADAAKAVTFREPSRSATAPRPSWRRAGTGGKARSTLRSG
jgi:hypothetical protein